MGFGVVSFTNFFSPFVHSLLSVRSLWLCLMWVLLLGLFDLGCGFMSVDVGLCRWWVWDVGLFDLVDLGCGFVWFGECVFVPISLVVCFFFFLRWRWWMWVCAGGG